MEQYKIIDYSDVGNGMLDYFLENDREIVFNKEKNEAGEDYEGYDIGKWLNENSFFENNIYVNEYGIHKDDKINCWIRPNEKVSICDMVLYFYDWSCIICKKDFVNTMFYNTDNVDKILENIDYILTYNGDEGSLYINEYIDNDFENRVMEKIRQDYPKATYKRKKLRVNIKQYAYKFSYDSKYYENDGDGDEQYCKTWEKLDRLSCDIVESCIEKDEKIFRLYGGVFKLEDLNIYDRLRYAQNCYEQYMDNYISFDENKNKEIENVKDIHVKKEMIAKLEQEDYRQKKIKEYEEKAHYKNNINIALSIENNKNNPSYWCEINMEDLYELHRYDYGYSIIIINPKKKFEEFSYAFFYDETDLFIYEKEEGVFCKNVWKNLKEKYPKLKKDGNRIIYKSL